jgi:two-component system chemotaxis response regulator CheY
MPERLKVIVGDDSAVARSLIVQALGELDVDVIEAASGNGVIRAINQNRPALVILDICMPYPDGLTVLRKIRCDEEFGELPVIMCSVESGPVERAEAEILGIAAYLTKPLDIRQLREVVKVALQWKPENS